VGDEVRRKKEDEKKKEKNKKMNKEEKEEDKKNVCPILSHVISYIKKTVLPNI
jgi:hypothetical protein